MKIFETKIESTTIVSEKAFTLLEVMVALSIIAIALTSVLGLQSQGLSLAGEARFHTTASLLSQHKISEIEITKPEDLVSGSGDFGEDFPGYSWKTDVNDLSFDHIEGISRHLKQIDLAVTRNDSEEHRFEIRLLRFIPETE